MISVENLIDVFEPDLRKLTIFLIIIIRLYEFI